MSEQIKSNVLNYLEQLGVSVTMLSRDNSTRPLWDSPPRKTTIPQPKRWHYRVQITRANCEPFVTDYWGSVTDYNHGQADLDVITFLSCLTWHSDDVSTFEDFCSCFGYDTDSIKALHTFEAVRAEVDALTRIFSEAERARMQEV